MLRNRLPAGSLSPGMMSLVRREELATYEIGQRIRGVRESRGMTQEELADGICSTGTLSKIENGLQVPKRKTFTALMQRLGEPEYLYSIHLSREEMQEMKICRQIERSIWKEDFVKTKELLEEYKSFLSGNKILENQCYRMMWASLHPKQNENPHQVMQEFEEALRITIKDYPNILPSKRQWLTFEEISILNNIAVQYYRIGEITKSFSYIKWLKEYLEQTNMDEETLAKVYLVVLCNYAEILWVNGQAEEAHAIASHGIELCKEYAQFMVLPHFLIVMARSFVWKGKAKEAEECLRQAESLFCIMDCYGA